MSEGHPSVKRLPNWRRDPPHLVLAIKCQGCLVQVSVEDRTASGCVYLEFKPDLSECDCIAAKQGMVYWNGSPRSGILQLGDGMDISSWAGPNYRVCGSRVYPYLFHCARRPHFVRPHTLGRKVGWLVLIVTKKCPQIGGIFVNLDV